MKIRFTTDVKYDGGGIAAEARTFEAGKTYELSEGSAAHWIHRGKAVAADEPVTPVTKTITAPPADKSLTSPAREQGVQTKAGVRVEGEQGQPPETESSQPPADADDSAPPPAKAPGKKKRGR